MSQPKRPIPRYSERRNAKSLSNLDRRWSNITLRLRQVRIDKGVNSKELADQLGITIDRLSTWELGNRSPHMHDFLVWLDALGITLEDALGLGLEVE